MTLIRRILCAIGACPLRYEESETEAYLRCRACGVKMFNTGKAE